MQKDLKAMKKDVNNLREGEHAKGLEKHKGRLANHERYPSL